MNKNTLTHAACENKFSGGCIDNTDASHMMWNWNGYSFPLDLSDAATLLRVYCAVSGFLKRLLRVFCDNKADASDSGKEIKVKLREIDELFDSIFDLPVSKTIFQESDPDDYRSALCSLAGHINSRLTHIAGICRRAEAKYNLCEDELPPDFTPADISHFGMRRTS